MSSSEEEGVVGNGIQEDGREVREVRRVLLSDFEFVLSPGRPARRIYDIEEALEFSREVGEAIRRERRNSNIILFAILCVLILVIIVFTLLFILVYKRVLVF